MSWLPKELTEHNQTLITHDACDTSKALSQMAGNSMHLRAVGLALCCLMKACEKKWGSLAASLLVASIGGG